MSYVIEFPPELPEREWFTLRHDGLYYEVFAHSPERAIEYFRLWHKTPVETNWIRRIPAPE